MYIHKHLFDTHIVVCLIYLTFFWYFLYILLKIIPLVIKFLKLFLKEMLIYFNVIMLHCCSIPAVMRNDVNLSMKNQTNQILPFDKVNTK